MVILIEIDFILKFHIITLLKISNVGDVYNSSKGKTGHADQLNIRKEYENTSLETNIYNGNLDTNKSNGDNVFAINLNIFSKN